MFDIYVIGFPHVSSLGLSLSSVSISVPLSVVFALHCRYASHSIVFALSLLQFLSYLPCAHLGASEAFAAGFQFLS